MYTEGDATAAAAAACCCCCADEMRRNLLSEIHIKICY